MTQKALNFDAAEKQRRKCNRQAILERLRQGPATNSELADVGGNRYGGRIYELRKQGHVIDVEGRGVGLFVYTLKGEA